MSWTDLFNPANPQVLTGQVDAGRLLDAAAHFPGGPALLVFLLFWSPVGPGIPAGVVLARHAGLSPALTFGLYSLTDLLGAMVCTPFFALLRRAAGYVPPLQWLGRRLLRLAMIGTHVPRAEDLRTSGRLAPALFRIGTIGFGVDVYSAGMVAAGLPVPRLLGWAAAILGDLVWFALLLGTSLAAAAVVNDDKTVGIVVLVAMVVIPQLAKRLFPALRDATPAPAAPVPAAAIAATASTGSGSTASPLLNVPAAASTSPSPAPAVSAPPAARRPEWHSAQNAPSGTAPVARAVPAAGQPERTAPSSRPKAKRAGSRRAKRR